MTLADLIDLEAQLAREVEAMVERLDPLPGDAAR
jgi:hypothetical protein